MSDALLQKYSNCAEHSVCCALRGGFLSSVKFLVASAVYLCAGGMPGTSASLAVVRAEGNMVLETYNLLGLRLFIKYLNEKKIAVK